ncbi:MAG: iron-containing redox enzyme family protein [Cyanobacteria bacterium]|nr:iron-containing redox enzyme family protein [Cyanobacteriota bacterium]
MRNIEIIKREWQKAFSDFQESPGIRRVIRADITVEHYKAYLREVYFHTRENPQLQALATVFFRGEQRQMVKPFYRHAISEIGHDQLALNDLVTLGADVSRIPFERPLPSTAALLAFGFYQIYNCNPVGYLGYLFHLEFMPTQEGKNYMNSLLSIGVPQEAMTFIYDHSTIDIAHNKFMEEYADVLIQTKEDLSDVIYAATVTCELYARFITGAFDSVDKPRSFGWSQCELTRSPEHGPKMEQFV